MTEIKQQQQIQNDDEIDLIALAKTFWKGRPKGIKKLRNERIKK
jgi:hypothetical protein